MVHEFGWAQQDTNLNAPWVGVGGETPLRRWEAVTVGVRSWAFGPIATPSQRDDRTQTTPRYLYPLHSSGYVISS